MGEWLRRKWEVQRAELGVVQTLKWVLVICWTSFLELRKIELGQ